MDQGLAHESALKEAETDATKQALMTFGNAFGLARDDKQQRQVATSHPAAEGSGPAARAPSGLLQGVLRCLPRAHEPTLPCGVHHHQPPAALDGECPGGEAIDLKPATLRLPNGSEKVLIRNRWSLSSTRSRAGSTGRSTALLEIPARTVDEPRLLVIGRIKNKHWSAVITMRGQCIRLISVSRSRPEGIQLYEQF